MSQAQPFQPNLHPDEEQGIPAADPGPGAPPTAPGFGEAYEPSEYGDDEAAHQNDENGDEEAARRTDNPFHPPDPDSVGPGADD